MPVSSCCTTKGTFLLSKSSKHIFPRSWKQPHSYNFSKVDLLPEVGLKLFIVAFKAEQSFQLSFWAFHFHSWSWKGCANALSVIYLKFFQHFNIFFVTLKAMELFFLKPWCSHNIVIIYNNKPGFSSFDWEMERIHFCWFCPAILLSAEFVFIKGMLITDFNRLSI